MKTMTILVNSDGELDADGGKEVQFECYSVREVEAAKTAKEEGKDVLVARECADPQCHDLLFGLSLDPNLRVECEDGYHNQRPGVWV